ncbi:L-threonylcarbamoyladenylate synthase [Paramuribaculum intestinale]|jgi:tRNA threonylcarbamoyl adenosine modification protein (Sua5/YciO/YrdC/YwlC family)|uniref:L-threonylcarbamoyladenylate synthase n=2 Tax=Muribaculaceae TaxID=2005473 RepID=UPI002676BB5E|nr:L-threonylcarbamoyladenylate synthase [Paramuribaculum intestinale]
MKILKFYPGSVNERNIAEAVDIIRSGGIVIYPTDTLYALGCDALNNRAIERLCRIKGLDPARQMLSVVCEGLSQAAEYARIDNRAFRVLKEYLPGPFTFILPASTTLPKVFKGRKTVGVRIPDNDVARALAAGLGNPVLSASVEAATPEELALPEGLALIYANAADALLDNGEGRIEGSTIVDLSDSSAPEVIREGIGIFEG